MSAAGLTGEQTAAEAVAAVLARQLDAIRANLEGTLTDRDPECLHDLRVAVRRSRSVLRQFKEVFPPAELERYREELRWLQRLTGEARDLDVWVLTFEDMRALVPSSMRADLDPLLAALRRRRLEARARMLDGLRSARLQSLLSGWEALLDRLARPTAPGAPSIGPLAGARIGAPAGARIGALAGARIGPLAGARIRKVHRRMVRMGRRIEACSPPADYHELRKTGKELRYLLELFGTELYPAEVVKPMVKALRALQDVLGRHQDREVQIALLRSLPDEIAALEGGPRAVLAMGALAVRLVDDARAAREQFAERFAAFASKRQRALVKETFA